MPLLLLLAACTPKPPLEAEPPSPPAWDSPAASIPCAPGSEASLWETNLADISLDRDDLGYTGTEWSQWGALVDNAFVLSWYLDVHHNPEAVPCFAGQVTTDLDAAAATAHPVAGLLTAYAQRADVLLAENPANPAGLTLIEAVDVLLDATGGAPDTADLANLDADLADALVPIVLAIANGVAVRHSLDDAIEAEGWGASKLFSQGPGTVLDVGRQFPDVSDADELEAFTAWYTGTAGPRQLVDPARQVAFAIEDADLSRFAGLDATLRIETPAGAFLVSPASADVHGDEEGALLFHLELGGDDSYTGASGATTDGDNPVAVLVDLGGDDAYGYVVVADSNDADGALVSDEDGRSIASGGYYVSASDTARQGAGRYGIGLLYDLGGTADTYASLRMSQGFGAMGVGVLADDGGDDVYAGEAGVQGAGVFGFGVLYDGGGDDRYTAWAFSQGFAYVGSGALAYDRAGNDTWWSDPGSDFGGVTLYYSPQLAGGQGNSSFTQGAGFGMRGDSYDVWLAGGFGTLRDADGNDTYTAGVFAQGTGYWEGTGLLADGNGDDSYDALWYIQGGAAHFALGVLLDGGGDDQYNPTFTPYNVMLGSGHDFSVGVAIDESGDDIVHYTTLAAGASNCQGIGVWVDNDGADTYRADSAYSTGLGNHSGECATRLNADSEGFFLDAGGDVDTYVWPEGDTRTPANDSQFGIGWAGTSDEFGGALDGDGETGFHVW